MNGVKVDLSATGGLRVCDCEHVCGIYYCRVGDNDADFAGKGITGSSSL